MTFFILAIRTSYCHSEGMCDYSLFLLEPLLLPNLGLRFLLGGEDCDTPSVTIAAIVFIQCLTMYCRSLNEILV
jgi:hypothetical protein